MVTPKGGTPNSPIPAQPDAQVLAIALRLHLPAFVWPRKNAALGLAGLGLRCGSVVAEFTSGFFFLPPGQLPGVNDVPHVLTS